MNGNFATLCLNFICGSVICAAAIAGPLADQVHRVQSANETQIEQGDYQTDLWKHLDLLQQACGKQIAQRYDSTPNIEPVTCVIVHDDICFRYSYYAQFDDGTIGLVAWTSPIFGYKPKTSCNLNVRLKK